MRRRRFLKFVAAAIAAPMIQFEGWLRPEFKPLRENPLTRQFWQFHVKFASLAPRGCFKLTNLEESP